MKFAYNSELHEEAWVTFWGRVSATDRPGIRMMAKEWRSPRRLFIELGNSLVVSLRILLHWTLHYLPDVPAILIRLAASAEDPRPYSLKDEARSCRRCHHPVVAES